MQARRRAKRHLKLYQVPKSDLVVGTHSANENYEFLCPQVLLPACFVFSSVFVLYIIT